MAQLDEILKKYVGPGAEGQGLQGAAFIVKDTTGVFLFTVIPITCPRLHQSLLIGDARQGAV